MSDVEIFKFIMEGREFTVSVKITDDDTKNLKRVVSGLVEQVIPSLNKREKKICEEVRQGWHSDSVKIKLKCLKNTRFGTRFEFVESFSDLRSQRSNFGNEKIESALYFDFSMEYPTKFKVDTDLMEYHEPAPNTTEVYCIRLFAGNCIKFFPSTETFSENAVIGEVKPFRRSKEDFLRWSILSTRESGGTVAGTSNNEVYKSIQHAWRRVKGGEGNDVFTQNMKEIQELMNTKDQRIFQGRKTTLYKRIEKLETIFNDKVFRILEVVPTDKRQYFLRMIDKYLGNIYYSETGGSRKNVDRVPGFNRFSPQPPAYAYPIPRDPSSSVVSDSAAATTSSSTTSSSGHSKRDFSLVIATNELVLIAKRLKIQAANLGELKNKIKDKLINDGVGTDLTKEDNISISKAVAPGKSPVFFKSLDEIDSRMKVQIHKTEGEETAQPVVGGYREPPKRKKRKKRQNTKRKNTKRKKRKNTKRKNTKRKNTKRKNTKKR